MGGLGDPDPAHLPGSERMTTKWVMAETVSSEPGDKKIAGKIRDKWLNGVKRCILSFVFSGGKENMKDNQKQEALWRSGRKLGGGHLRDKNECCIIDA